MLSLIVLKKPHFVSLCALNSSPIKISGKVLPACKESRAGLTSLNYTSCKCLQHTKTIFVNSGEASDADSNWDYLPFPINTAIKIICGCALSCKHILGHS